VQTGLSSVRCGTRGCRAAGLCPQASAGEVVRVAGARTGTTSRPRHAGDLTDLASAAGAGGCGRGPQPDEKVEDAGHDAHGLAPPAALALADDLAQVHPGAAVTARLHTKGRPSAAHSMSARLPRSHPLRYSRGEPVGHRRRRHLDLPARLACDRRRRRQCAQAAPRSSRSTSHLGPGGCDTSASLPSSCWIDCHWKVAYSRTICMSYDRRAV